MGQKVLGDPARGSPMALGEQGYVSCQEGWLCTRWAMSVRC